MALPVTARPHASQTFRQLTGIELLQASEASSDAGGSTPLAPKSPQHRQRRSSDQITLAAAQGALLPASCCCMRTSVHSVTWLCAAQLSEAVRLDEHNELAEAASTLMHDSLAPARLGAI